MPGIEALTKRHVIAEVRYRDEYIRCTCGHEIIAEPDTTARKDRHEPLGALWNAHRLAYAVKREPKRNPATWPGTMTPAKPLDNLVGEGHSGRDAGRQGPVGAGEQRNADHRTQPAGRR